MKRLICFVALVVTSIAGAQSTEGLCDWACWIQGARYRVAPSKVLFFAPTAADIAGFRLHYGPSPDMLFQVRQINDPNVLAYWPKDLPAGRYYFALTAFTTDGQISPLSAVVMRTVP